MLEPRWVLSTAYIAHDLVSDQPGVTPILDEHLVNAWGLALGPAGGNFWVSSNEEGISTLYTGDVGGAPLSKNPLEVNIPGGAPTGQVFNGTSDFDVDPGAASAPAFFIFASESGTVSGWNPNVPLPAPSHDAQLKYQAPDGAVYKGIALANNGSGNFLYLADFANGKIDVLNSSFAKTTLAGSFTDPNLPAGYAPFNVAAIGGQIYVAYAQPEAGGGDEVHGNGLGLVDVYTTNGAFVRRLVNNGNQGHLNAPWAMVVAPAGFGDFSGDLLVGNVGSGHINAYNPTTGAFLGALGTPGRPIEIEELWGLAFGNGTAGDTHTLYYAAGPEEEEHGLFGKITANAAGTSAVQAAIVGDVLDITGGRDGDHVTVGRNLLQHKIVVEADGRRIGAFDESAIQTIEFHGFAGNDSINVLNTVKIKTLLDGGADNDSLFGGGGPNILLGGPGNDWLVGGPQRDVIIGGEGRDIAFGSGGEDLMIGGSTAHDSNAAALLAILAEWTSADAFNVRVDKLTNGTGGLPALNSTTVTDDNTRDFLFGGFGHDWLFNGSGDFLFEFPG